MLKPPKPFQLRAMRLADITAVMEIEHAVFPTPWKASAYEYEITGNRLARYQVLTQQQGDRPSQLIGYAGFWLISGEAHVSTIAIDLEWRGRGLGELLFLSILDLACANGAYLVTLEVRRSNLTAQSLYRKYRFQVVGERPRYYEKTEDAILMTIEPLDDDFRVFLRGQRRNLFERLAQEKNVSNK